MRRREFITLLGGAVAMGPLAARATAGVDGGCIYQRRVGEADARQVVAFRKGLDESGYVEAQSVTVEYHWLEGQYRGLPVVAPQAQEDPVAICAYEARLQTRSASRARLEWRQGRVAAYRNRAEPEAAR
jgi:putative ABC transport system substrate-binding protein